MSPHHCASTTFSYTPLLGTSSLRISFLPVCLPQKTRTSLRVTALSYRLFVIEKNKISLEHNECLKSFGTE